MNDNLQEQDQLFSPKVSSFQRAYSQMGIDLPAIEASEKLQGKVDKAVEWINSTIDTHKMMCKAHNNPVITIESAKGKCNCGLDELLKILKG